MVKKVLIISPNSSYGGAATANQNIAHMIHMSGIEVVYNDEFLKTDSLIPYELSNFSVYGNLKNKHSLVQYIMSCSFDYVLIGDNRVAIHYFFQLLKLKRNGIRIGIIFHSLNIGQTIHNKISDWLVSIATLCANDLLYVSKFTQDSWNTYLIPRITQKKGRIIYNAVKAIESIGNKLQTRPNVLFVGRFSPEKRPELFCRIAKAFSDRYNFIMWGNGPLYEDLCQKYKEYVKFMGYGSDIETIYLGASLIVVPSVFENCPMCILESMVRGIPCICTKVGGIPEIVKSEVNGEFLDISDAINSFNECSKRIFNNYDQYRSNCLKISQSYVFENISQKWKYLIENVK